MSPSQSVNMAEAGPKKRFRKQTELFQFFSKDSGSIENECQSDSNHNDLSDEDHDQLEEDSSINSTGK